LYSIGIITTNRDFVKGLFLLPLPARIPQFGDKLWPNWKTGAKGARSEIPKKCMVTPNRGATGGEAIRHEAIRHLEGDCRSAEGASHSVPRFVSRCFLLKRTQ